MERLFDHLEIDPIGLERIRAVEAPGVTHVGFHIVEKRSVQTAKYPLEIHKEKNNV